jgi:hypothetical protein
LYDVIGDPLVLGKDQAILTVSLSIEVTTAAGVAEMKAQRRVRVLD